MKANEDEHEKGLNTSVTVKKEEDRAIKDQE